MLWAVNENAADRSQYASDQMAALKEHAEDRSQYASDQMLLSPRQMHMENISNAHRLHNRPH